MIKIKLKRENDIDIEKPNYELSGKLTEYTNTYRVIKNKKIN